MDYKNIEEKVTGLCREYLCGRGFELVELSFYPDARGFDARILADRPEGGITLEECASVNKDLVRLVEEKLEGGAELIYTFEVSSPGLDRLLRVKKDFARCKGATVHFFLKEPLLGKVEPEGVIIKVDDDFLEADIGGETVKVPFGIINMAKQLISRNRE